MKNAYKGCGGKRQPNTKSRWRLLLHLLWPLKLFKDIATQA